MTSASKVSELFTAAGEAFTKLAELAQVVQTSLNNASDGDIDDSYSNHNASPSWTAEDTAFLQLAVKRFGDDLNIISEHIKDKTMCQIKSTFKKLQSTASNKGDDSNVQTQSYSNSTARVVSSFEDLDNLRVPTSSADRSGLPLAISNSTSESLSSSLVGTKISVKQSNMSNTATNCTLTTESSVLSTQMNNTAVTATSSSTTSICPSPSPFLHYPLLRKSADITLNMLNARDDSDDEDRKAGLSVFNST